MDKALINLIGDAIVGFDKWWHENVMLEDGVDRFIVSEKSGIDNKRKYSKNQLIGIYLEKFHHHRGEFKNS